MIGRSAAAVAVLALAANAAFAQQPATKTLKMQATWPTAVTAWDNFLFLADRIDKLTAGSLKIETLPAGQVVPAFETLDAVNRKVLDGGHSIAYFWSGKNKAAVLFTGGPGGPYGMDMIDFIGWMYEGGGWPLYQEFYTDVIKMNVIGFPDATHDAAGLRLVQAADQEPGRPEGHEVPPDRNHGRGVPEDGHVDGEPAAGRDHSGGAARRHRLRRVCRRHGRPQAWLPRRLEVPLHARACTSPPPPARSSSTSTCGKTLTPQQQEAVRSAANESFSRWWASGRRARPRR